MPLINEDLIYLENLKGINYIDANLAAEQLN